MAAPGAIREVVEGKEFNFAKEEEGILAFWDEIAAFETQLKNTEGQKEYIFYDGPPFATGLPHYGHILAGTIKDIVTRYASCTGHHVIRRFGWDCHGLPVEHEIDKKLEIKSRDDVMKMGIDVYNEECRSIVMRYSKQWEVTVKRLGRWIDFENDYKTLDPSFMESVWWVFSQLHKKGLVYRGFKVMPFSTACSTPLANFEAGLNYKDVSDPAVMVSFPVKGDADGASLVAWTTTPWTLPSNLALCVHPEFTYVKVRNPATGAVFIVAESRLEALPGAVPKGKKSAAAASGGGGGKGGKKSNKGSSTDVAAAAAAAPAAEAAGGGDNEGGDKSGKGGGGFEVIGKMAGSELVGLQYEPLFPYFSQLAGAGAFVVCSDTYVTDDSGTGVVHQAPAFGEDDYRVCIAHGVIEKGEGLPCPVDLNGRFTEEVTDFAGTYVKDADKAIIAAIKAKGRLVDLGVLVHSYPYCWRSDTPLIYRAVPSWFVAVESIKDKLLANNTQTYWVPSYVKEKRFHNWLEGAHDWAVSRSRFWGTPIPIWMSEDGEEIRVVGSIEELQELSGKKVTDLHRHFIDDITIPSTMGKGQLRRVDDVFDCWFESGSMPYGQLHYPFENKELFESNFPADFVAEGLDQTRGWFYTLMVLSTALFDRPAFKNLVCNGLVLASDGKKMSKRLKNYPDPTEVIDKYGADALRLYLINSPVVRAETLRFKEDGVFGVVKDVFLPWYNAYRFLVQNILRSEQETGAAFDPLAVDLDAADNVLDKWIAAASRSLVAFVRQEMAAYRLYTVVPYLVQFLEGLTNVYVRYNRKRLKGGKGAADCAMALSILFDVLLTACKVMSPFTPFLTEAMYRNLRRVLPPGSPESVHFCSVPEAREAHEGDSRIERSVARMQRVIELGRVIRERQNRPLKAPLARLVVVHADPEFLADIEGDLREYVESELNVRSVETCGDPLTYASLRAEPDWQVLGKRLGKDMGKVAAAIRGMGAAELMAYEKAGSISLEGHELGAGDIRVLHDFKAPEGVAAEDIDAAGDGEVLAVLDLRSDPSLIEAGMARELVNRFQRLRKKAGLTVTDAVELYYEQLPSPPSAAGGGGGEAVTVRGLIERQGEYLRGSLGSLPLPLGDKPDASAVIAREETTVGGDTGCVFAAVLAAPAGGGAAAATAAAAGKVAQLAVS
ncbi:MAG: hypothetical protein J3K34DRAFT_182080 [Monoraphidium minutum]|nr:MAG: hypothetical protein J3K34DRAFT_182080 [Monoraphidium minutum]